MSEKMDDFFNQRVNSYDNHMKTNIENFDLFYQKIINPIQTTKKPVSILDLGCGTGLEIEGIIKKVPNALITGIDMSRGMLEKLKKKYNHIKAQLNLIHGSYLEIELGVNIYDYCIAVMTMHHFTYETKVKLYQKIYRALKLSGVYIEGDFTVSKEEELLREKEYKRIISNITDYKEGDYHIDLPFSIDRQRKLLSEAGFIEVNVYKVSETASIFTANK
jgi:tRNA (cmo5U34)-methyltransferase